MSSNDVIFCNRSDGNEEYQNFMRAVYQVNNIACLMKQKDDGSIVTEYVTPSFASLLECDSQEEAFKLLEDGKFFTTTLPERRGNLEGMPEEMPDKTVSMITKNGNKIWCAIHYAFIDEYENHYIYATFADVTKLKRYEEQLQSVYSSLGESFHKTDDDSLARVRANLTNNYVEEANGISNYVAGNAMTTYVDALEYRASYFPIDEERQIFLNTFSIDALTSSYMDGVVSVSKVLYSRLPNNAVFYVKITANVTRHPFSGDLIVFITEESNNPEKLASTINGKILAKQFDLVAYIARDIYDVAIGDAAMIEHGNIFPRVKHGSYREYLESQIIPALPRDEAYRRRIREAMDLKTVFEMFKVKEPYSVDIEVDMEDGHFYKRFDFYSVDPESEYCIVLKTDTTEVRLEQLEQEERRLELEYSKQELADTDTIMADAGFGMWHMTLEEGKPSRLRANAKMKELLGIAGKDLTEEEIYDAWYSHVPESERPGVKTRIEEMLSGKLSECINLWIHPDGHEMYTRFGGTVVADENGRQSLRGYYSDVTETVREDRAQRDALADALIAAENANKAKTAFLNSVSHDIRTPMNAIVGFTALATSHIDQKDLVQDYLSKITVSSQHLLSLINDVLDMSRIESGKMTLDESPVHLPDLIHDLRTIIHANVNAKQLNLNIDTQDVVNEDIITDKLRLNQVFLNILSNAIKFTPNGGAISFLVTEKPSPIPEHGVFEFRIKDTGIGMSKDFQKTIFEAFTREKTSTVSGIQGTGLGMAIIKSIVDMMGGTISVSSEEGKGTEFIVTIPCRLNKEAVHEEGIIGLQGLRALAAYDDTLFQAGIEEKEEKPVDFSGMRILLAEDNEMNQLIAQAILTEAGLEVEIAGNGEEAVRMMREAPAGTYNIILMDIQMPIMDGYKAARLIRGLEDKAKAEIPIVAVTANAFEEDRKLALEAGMNGHLAKPYDIPKMMETLKQLLL